MTIQNDTYGEITPAELAVLRLHAQRCITCGMLATVDPAFHAARYAHAPRINHGGGIIFRWDSERHEWTQETPAKCRICDGTGKVRTTDSYRDLVDCDCCALVTTGQEPKDAAVIAEISAILRSDMGAVNRLIAIGRVLDIAEGNIPL